MWLLIRISETAATDPRSQLARPMSWSSPNRGMAPSGSETPCALRRCPPARATQPPRGAWRPSSKVWTGCKHRKTRPTRRISSCLRMVSGTPVRSSSSRRRRSNTKTASSSPRDPSAPCRPRKSSVPPGPGRHSSPSRTAEWQGSPRGASRRARAGVGSSRSRSGCRASPGGRP